MAFVHGQYTTWTHLSSKVCLYCRMSKTRRSKHHLTKYHLSLFYGCPVTFLDGSGGASVWSEGMACPVCMLHGLSSLFPKMASSRAEQENQLKHLSNRNEAESHEQPNLTANRSWTNRNRYITVFTQWRISLQAHETYFTSFSKWIITALKSYNEFPHVIPLC